MKHGAQNICVLVGKIGRRTDYMNITCLFFLWWTVKKGEIFEAEDENGVVHACLNKCHGKQQQRGNDG